MNEGVFSLVSIRNGELRVGDKIKFGSNPSKIYDVKVNCFSLLFFKRINCFLLLSRLQKLGVFHPDEVPVEALYTGQMGFVSAFVHDLEQVNLGDLIFKESDKIPEDFTNLLKKPQQMVYASLFPYDQKDATNLKQAISRIHLTDKSVEIEKDSNQALGAGWRLGFQGLLHMDVFCQRLDYEFNAPSVITTPQVSYKVKIKGAKNIKTYGTDVFYVKSADKLPDRSIIEKMEEPMIKATLMLPNEYLEPINVQARERRGKVLSTKFVDQNNILMEIRYPLSEIITNFYDELKTLSSGYASFDYVDDGYQEINAVILTFNINKEPLDELTMIVPKQSSKELAHAYCERIKKCLKQQLYDVVIHGCINSKIIAKREIKAGGNS